MFAKILNANDGSETGFRSFSMAITLAKENRAELHMVCVEEIPYMPEFVQEVEQQDEKTARRIQGLLKHAQAMADAEQAKLRDACAQRPSRPGHRATCGGVEGRFARDRRRRPFGDL